MATGRELVDMSGNLELSVVPIAEIKEIRFSSNAGYTGAEVRISGIEQFKAVFSIGATGESVSVWNGSPVPIGPVYQTLLAAAFQASKMKEAEKTGVSAEFSIPWNSALIAEVSSGILSRKSAPDVSFYGIIVELAGIRNDFFVVDWSEDCLYLSERIGRAQDCKFTQEDLNNFTALADRKLSSRMKKTMLLDELLGISPDDDATRH